MIEQTLILWIYESIGHVIQNVRLQVNYGRLVQFDINVPLVLEFFISTL